MYDISAVTSKKVKSFTTTNGSIPTGDLLDKKLWIACLFDSGTPSASAKSTAIITLPNLGGSNSSPPKAKIFFTSGNSLWIKIL